MESLGTDISASGSVMTKGEMEEFRRRRGECITCGQKCFQKKMFKMNPITITGKVMEGRCLRCKPLAQVDTAAVVRASTRTVTQNHNIQKFHESQKRLAVGDQTSSRNLNYGRSSSTASNSGRQSNLKRSNTSPAATVSTSASTGSSSHHSVSSHPAGRQGSSKSMESCGGVSKDSIPEEEGEESQKGNVPDRSFQSAVYAEMAANSLAKNFRERKSKEEVEATEPNNSETRDGGPVHGVLDRGGAMSFEKAGDNTSDQSMPSSKALPQDDGMDGSKSDSVAERAYEKIMQAGNDVACILEVMKENPDSAPIQEDALTTLAKLNYDESMNSSLKSLDGFSFVVKALKSHPIDTPTQCSGIDVISKLSLDSTENQIKLIEAGALDVILEAMTEFDEDSEVQGKALVAIGNLSTAVENLSTILEKRTVEKVVASMNRHSEVEEIQLKGCFTLSKMASHDSPLKKKILDDGAGGCAVISMVMHSDNADIQSVSLQVFCNLYDNFDENIEGLIGVGAIDSTVTAMQVHRDEATVQMLGACVLGTLAVSKEAKEIIGDGGGIDVLVRAMWVHAEDINVNQKCAKALCVICQDIHNAGMLVEVGGISATVTAMQTHADDADLQAYCCGILKNMAEIDDQTKMKIVEEEAIDAIVMTMVLHGDNESCQYESCRVLGKLAIEYNIEPMIAANVNELVGMALANFPEECGEEARRLQSLLAG